MATRTYAGNRRVRHWARLLAVVVGIGSLSGLLVSPSFAGDEAELYFVQGLPRTTVEVQVDGKTVDKSMKTADVAGPFTVAPGRHRVTVRSEGTTILDRSMTVKARSSADVVVHLPAQASGKPTLTVYGNDLSAVPRDKASVTVAHTAAVPPADIVVDDKVLFANVANGESLNLVVPVGTYSVKIVPTGESKPTYLGPLDLAVKGGSLNKVYAVGDPSTKTMNVAVHIIAMSSAGSSRPSKVDTGTGGQVAAQDTSWMRQLLR